jgi:hypothetical protein
MGTAKVIFAVDPCGRSTGSDVTDVTRPEAALAGNHVRNVSRLFSY